MLADGVSPFAYILFRTMDIGMDGVDENTVVHDLRQMGDGDMSDCV